VGEGQVGGTLKNKTRRAVSAGAVVGAGPTLTRSSRTSGTGVSERRVIFSGRPEWGGGGEKLKQRKRNRVIVASLGG